MKVSIKGNRKIPMKKNMMKLFTSNGKPRMAKSEELKTFEQYLSLIARAQMNVKGIKRFTGDVRLHLEVCFGDHRRRDLQNCFGCVCDALNGIVYDDDDQIVELSARKRVQTNKWSFTIVVEEIQENQGVA